MVAAHLARRGVDSVLIEARDVAGQGTAFSTPDPAHLLNVPAGNMSAWPDDAGDFAREAGAEPGEFVERRRFGAYLRDILHRAIASGHTQLVRDTAVAAERHQGCWTVALEGGDRLDAKALVLAVGNQPPASLPFGGAAGDRVVANPWGEQARAAVADAVEQQRNVLIVGTGLTMVDVVLSLDCAGHRGRIVALSRRGLAPRGHAAGDPAPVERPDVPGGSARGLLAWLREQSGRTGWRAAVDSLRPHSPQLWESLGLDEQKRFLRHARPWWDVHRHRIAPEVARRVEELVAGGRLQIAAGRLLGASPVADGVEVEFRRRGDSAPTRESFGWIFNCTGPLHDVSRTRDPLLRNLLDGGMIEADELGIGLAVDDRSRADPSTALWALGALTKGRYWEIIAVPDIRNQAAQVAEDIAKELGQ